MKEIAKSSLPKEKMSTTKRQKLAVVLCCLLLACACFPGAALADGENPLDVVNSLSDFIFSIIRAIGVILLGWGIVQIGLALKSHDPSQRANGFLTFAGGVIIMFAKEILNRITGGAV